MGDMASCGHHGRVRDGSSSNKAATHLSPPPEIEESVEQLLAKEMKSMSLQDRGKAYEDIHGVSTTTKETPQLIENKLVELEDCLQHIAHKAAYDLAFAQSKEYVTNAKFRLMFLRSESFQTAEAAQRIVRFFQTKLEFWGIDKLSQRITFDDLDPLTQHVTQIAGGYTLLLPSRDTSGRAVIFSFERYQKQFFRTDDPRFFNNRILWYFLMCIVMDDEETQKNGVVCVSYGLDFTPSLDADERSVWWGACGVLNTVPIRIVGFHYCYNLPQLQPIIALMTMGLAKDARCRMRTHYGTSQECMYALMSFGLPVSEIPVSQKDAVKNGETFLKWLERRKLLERQYDKYKDCIESPMRYDVLLGKGRRIQSYMGNRRLHDVVASRYGEYDNCDTRLKKRKIVDEILDHIKTTPAKFLKRDEYGFWVEAKYEVAIDKIGHCFRRKREVISATNQNRPTTQGVDGVQYDYDKQGRLLDCMGASQRDYGRKRGKLSQSSRVHSGLFCNT